MDHAIRTRRKVFYNLDLLRGVAAVCVVGRHMNHAFLTLLPGSFMAVDLFFALSGFVLCHSYEQKILHGGYFISFGKARLIRLYPLYILGTGLGILFAAAYMVTGYKEGAGPATMFYSILLSVAMLPATASLTADGFHIYPFNFPAWSLFWELVINSVYAALVFRLRRLRAVVAVLILGAAVLLYASTVYQSFDGGSNVTSFWMGGAKVIYAFFIGVACYRLWAAEAFPSWNMPFWVAPALLLLLFAVPAGAHSYGYNMLAVMIGCPLVLVLGVYDVPEKVRGWAKYLGISSYAIYAIHAPIIKVESAVRQHYRIDRLWGNFVLEATFILFLLAIAGVLDRYYDLPVRKWLGRRAAAPPSLNLDREASQTAGG